MDAELLELQKQFESAQQAKSSIRLSERNVVELVQKLHELKIIDFDLLHTVTGKEYITPEQLRHEIVLEITKSGRVSLIDLADTIGVDLYHIEKHSQAVVSDDSSLMLINGEIISNSYWDTVAEEVNDRLQECSQISLAELAGQLQVGSELIATVLEPRIGKLIKGRLEGGQLYTPAYVARVNAMVLGAARAITVPTNLSALWSSLQQLLQEMNGASGVAVDNSFFQTLFNVLVKDGEILGTLRNGVNWTPAVFAIAQKESVDSFFSQNSFISYDYLQKLSIPQPVQYLQARYPEGIPLATMFVHPSTIDMLDAAAEDAIERGSWIDPLSVLPTSFGSQDASKILSLCRSVQVALKSDKAILLGESYVFSTVFIKEMFDRLDKEMVKANLSGSSSSGQRDNMHETRDSFTRSELNSSLSESNEIVNESASNRPNTDKGSKKKKGKSAGNVKNVSAETNSDNQETYPTKSKKNQRKGKDSTSNQSSDSKSGAKKELGRTKEESFNLPEEWLVQKIMLLVPEFEDQGLDDPETILRPLAEYFRPLLINSWNERRKARFTQNAQRLKTLADDLQRKTDESFLNMQLYEKALDFFDDDQSTSVILHRHLLRTTASTMVDTILISLDMQNKLKNGVEIEEPQSSEAAPLSSAERAAMAKTLPGPLSVRAVAVLQALEGKRVETFMTAIRDLVEESGMNLRKLDKKLEKNLLHAYRKDLTAQVSAETDAVSLLAKVVSLLYVQVNNRALQAPGRAISVAVSRLKEKLDESAYKILTDYHSATVTLLALMSAATGDAEDCSSDRILSKKEVLEELMPALKGLVLNSSSQT